MYEKTFLVKSLLLLNQNTGIESKLTGRFRDSQSDSSYGFIVELQKGDTRQKFLVYIKLQPSLSELGLLINHNRDAKILLVADYVNPTLSHFLRENNCDFIDSAGNAFLNFGSVFVYIMGNNRPELLADKKSSRAFQGSGLTLIFALLCHPNNVLNYSYRELSKISGVSSDSIGLILYDLKTAGYLLSEKNNKRKWGDRDGLIKRWVVAYSEKLKPKLVLGYYQSLQKNWRDSVDIKSYGALWSGEVAADRLTHYLKPEFSTIYTQEKLGKLVLMNSLKEVLEKSSGNVEVLQKFWHFHNHDNPDLAPTLLIYADLISSGNSRNLEVAEIIYNKYLACH